MTGSHPKALIVHGGAGRFAERDHAAAVAGCERAREAGWAVLDAGGSALDAVEAAVRLLEDDPLYDAGRGSYRNTEGEVEMDAILVDGATLRFGAVAAIRNVGHPISVARRVMESTPHCMLVGEGATQFARQQGFPFVPTEYLAPEPMDTPGQDTVGAVAIDAAGHIAVATSTGGIRNKLPGRVGDSPLIGCGAIADDALGGVSATGEGEYIMRVMLSRQVLERLRECSPTGAARRAIAYLAERTGGHGGVIVIDAHGRIGLAHNTDHMPHACIDAGGQRASGVVASRREDT